MSHLAFLASSYCFLPCIHPLSPFLYSFYPAITSISSFQPFLLLSLHPAITSISSFFLSSHYLNFSFQPFLSQLHPAITSISTYFLSWAIPSISSFLSSHFLHFFLLSTHFFFPSFQPFLSFLLPLHQAITLFLPYWKRNECFANVWSQIEQI